MSLKDHDLPRVKVSPDRKQRYLKAYRKVVSARPDVTFSSFVREAMDMYSALVLDGRPPAP